MYIARFVELLLWVTLIMSPIYSQTGDCVTAVPPFSVNGVNVDHSFNENVMVRNDNPAYPICLGSGLFLPPPILHFGYWEINGSIINPYVYNLFFSKPITHLEFFLAGGHKFPYNGDTICEDFIFESFGCNLSMYEIFGCDVIIENNVIELCGLFNAGNGHFRVEFEVPVFTLTISGLGGGAGSAFKICSNSIQVAPLWASIAAPELVCTQDSILFTAFEGEPNTHPPPYTFSYTLNGVAQTVTTTGLNDSAWVLTPTTPGTYTYELLSVTDANGNIVNISCNNTRTVVVAQPPTAQFTASPTSGFAPLEVNLQNQSSNATEYEWLIGGFGSSQPPTSIAENPVLTLNETGVYEITLVASNDLGCADTTVQTVHVLEQLQVVIPNVFTPNNDGVNDWFGITSNVEANASIVILNRWGNVIFEKEFVTTPNVFEPLWDGTSTGSVTTPGSGEAVDGVYFYRVKVGEEDPKAIEFSGFVHLKK